MVGVRVPVEEGVYPPPPPPPDEPPPEAGGGGVTVGGETVLATVMDMVEVARLPAASWAVAVRVWVPFVTPNVFHCPS